VYGFSPGSISRPDSKAKLVLVGRSDRLQKSSGAMATHDPEDAISCKIQKVQALEALELRFDYQCRCCQSRANASGDRAVTKTLWQDSRCHPRCRSCGCWHDST